jgi:hypothetical protein
LGKLKMALILPGLKCPLCEARLGEGTDLVATSHFVADRNHRLWRFSDAAMHRSCFLSWEHRLEFIELFNATAGRFVFGNGTHHHMHSDGRITSEPAPP